MQLRRASFERANGRSRHDGHSICWRQKRSFVSSSVVGKSWRKKRRAAAFEMVGQLASRARRTLLQHCKVQDGSLCVGLLSELRWLCYSSVHYSVFTIFHAVARRTKTTMAMAERINPLLRIHPSIGFE